MRIKIYKDHITWGNDPWFRSCPHYFYWWVWMGFEDIDGISFIGGYATYYDGVHRGFRLGPISFQWSTRWTKLDKDDDNY